MPDMTTLPTDPTERILAAAQLLAAAWPTSTLPAGVDPVVAGQTGLQALTMVTHLFTNFGQAQRSDQGNPAVETNNWFLTGTKLDPSQLCPAGTLPSADVQRCVYVLNNPTEGASSALQQALFASPNLAKALYQGDIGRLMTAMFLDGYASPGADADVLLDDYADIVAQAKADTQAIANALGQPVRLQDSGYVPTRAELTGTAPTGSTGPTGAPPTSITGPTGTDNTSGEKPEEKKGMNWWIWGPVIGVAVVGGGFLVSKSMKDDEPSY